MTPERWSKVREIFDAAVARAPAGRAAFLDEACAGDSELRREVESLLASARGAPSSFLESPAPIDVSASSDPSPRLERLARGSRLGPYEIVGLLGAGGMGEVYRARDERLDRDVAIKVLPERFIQDAEALSRFQREAKSVAALSHPNILAIYDFGTSQSVAYAVTELLEGETLRDQLESHRISKEQAFDYALQIARGLAAAHEKGIVHRDLKPENLFITKHDQVKILDFGLAKRVHPIGPNEESSAPTVSGHTVPGTVMGTVGYMSPEQVRGLLVDHRSDIFSFGAILYEMLSGNRAFSGATAADTLSAILKEEPEELTGSGSLSLNLKPIVRRCLEKDRERRLPSAKDLVAELAAASGPGGASGPPTAPAAAEPPRLARDGVGRRRNVLIAITATVAVGAVITAWLWQRNSRERWVLETAIPEITRLVEAGEYLKAASLARQARTILPKDPAVEKLWNRATGDASIETTPPGAEVSIRPYVGDQNTWESVGQTPLVKIRVANTPFVWRISKPGFASTFLIDSPTVQWNINLLPQSRVPPEMVSVPGGDIGYELTQPLIQARQMRLDDYLIDRHEVTNEEFKKFIDAGGYERREFWKQAFVKDGRALTWDEAVTLFRDTTGRPGPSTWEAGTYLKAQGKYPVAGVSWYEAAAFAEFAGKSLPTVYHWAHASQPDFVELIVRGGNFGLSGTQPVEAPGSLSGFGTTDMAGNVKEWCWNETRGSKRFILGGGFGEPTYMFQQADAQAPWERRANYGFRCAKYLAPLTPVALERIDPAQRDYSKEKPVTNDLFQVFKGLYAYDKKDLNARTEETERTAEWTREKVSFDAAYSNERVTAHLFLPTGISPPYETVVIFPGAGATETDKFPTSLHDHERAAYLVQGGRAILWPIYKSTFERRDGYTWHGAVITKSLWRDHLIMWSKDLGRSLDYLQTRKDIDATKLAYYGLSWGAAVAPILLTVDDRFRAAILVSGGFYAWPNPPEADPINFVTRVNIPTLMLSDRYDLFFTMEASQLPFFRLLGTAEREKRRVVYDSGHGGLPHKEEVRESLDWLDKYLGPVKRRSPGS